MKLFNLIQIKMRFREKNVEKCLSYLKKIHSLTNDGIWHEPTNVFGFKVKDHSNSRGYTIQPYWRKFNLSVRISRQAFIELGLMETNKRGKKTYYRWIGDAPDRTVAINLLKISYALKKGESLETIDYLSHIPTNVKKTINTMVKKHIPKPHQEQVQETKKNNMVVIQENFDRLFEKFDKQEKEFITLKTQNQELIGVLGMVLNQIMKDGDKRVTATKNREINYEYFERILRDVEQQGVLNKGLLINLIENSKTIFNNTEIAKEEILKSRKKENLFNLLKEVIEDHKTE
jgi:hypothetical protein